MYNDVRAHELEAATMEAATRTERSINVLLQSAAATSVETCNVRGDVSALLEAIRGLRIIDSSSDDASTLASATGVPGLWLRQLEVPLGIFGSVHVFGREK